MALKKTSKYVGVSNKSYHHKEQDLFKAAENGDLEKVKELVAQFGYSKIFLNRRDAVTGKTALILAAAKNRTKVIGFLLRHGADARIQDAGNYTAADYARTRRDKSSFVTLRLYQESQIRLLKAN